MCRHFGPKLPHGPSFCCEGERGQSSGPSLCPYTALAATKSLQSCPTLCDPIDGSPPGSPVPGILQARTLEWVAVSLSNAWKWKVKVKLLSRVRLFATPWTAAHQAPPSMGVSRQEYWGGVPLPSPTLLLGQLIPVHNIALSLQQDTCTYALINHSSFLSLFTSNFHFSLQITK